MQGQEHYSVVLAWGRVGNQKRRQVFLLDSLEKVDNKLLKLVLRTRCRHAYQLADRSRSFPRYPILEEFQKAAPFPSRQLSLFGWCCLLQP